MLRVQTSPVRFLEATNQYSPGDRTICIAVSCTPKFTMGIVFALLCLFSNMPFKLEEFNLRMNIAVKTCVDRKYCGFFLSFFFSDFQFSKIRPGENDLGTCGLFQEAISGSTRRKQGKRDREEKKIWKMLMSKLPCGQAETQACWGPSEKLCGMCLRISLLENIESVMSMDFHPHWLKFNFSSVHYPALQGAPG